MLNNFYISSLILFSVLSFGLGLFAILKNPRSSSSRLWLFVNIAAGFWSFFLFQNVLSYNSDQALFYAKALHVAAVFVPIFFYHFISKFLYQKDGFYQRIFLISGYFLAIFFALISFFSNLIVSGVSERFGFEFWVETGKYYPILLVYFSIYSLMALYPLIKGYFKSDGVRRKKIFYVLLAFVVGFFGASTNFLPQTLGIYPYGSFVAWVYPLLITYGIFIGDVKISIKR